MNSAYSRADQAYRERWKAQPDSRTYEFIAACGHTDRMKPYKGRRQTEALAFNMGQPCSECRRTEQNTAALAWRDARGLEPIVQGTGKQNQWAEAIRYQFVTAFEAFRDAWPPADAESLYLVARCTDELERARDSRWFIDRRNADVADVAREVMPWPFWSTSTNEPNENPEGWQWIPGREPETAQDEPPPQASTPHADRSWACDNYQHSGCRNDPGLVQCYCECHRPGAVLRDVYDGSFPTKQEVDRIEPPAEDCHAISSEQLQAMSVLATRHGLAHATLFDRLNS